MIPSATVVLIAPYVPESSRVVFALRPFAGTTVIRALVDHLWTGLGPHGFEFRVVYPESTWYRAQLAAALAGTPAIPIATAGLTDIELVADLCRRERSLRTMLLYPAHAAFPSCSLATKMCAHHLLLDGDATECARYPPGYSPDIVSARAVQRLQSLIPFFPGRAIEAMKVLTKHSAGSAEYSFRVLNFAPVSDCEVPRHCLPQSVLIEDDFIASAAESVLLDTKLIPALSAQSLKLEILRRRIAPARRRPRPSTGSGVCILFVSNATAFSGAEQSWLQLITRLNRERYRPVVLLPSASELSARLDAAGVDVVIAEEDCTRLTPEALAMFDELLKSCGTRILHINGYAGPACVVAASQLNIPIIWHMRHCHPEHVVDLLRFSTRIIAVSEACADAVRSLNLDPAMVTVIYNGVDDDAEPLPSRDQVRRQFMIPEQAFVLGMVARICENKCQHRLVETARLLRTEIPELFVVFAGEAYRDSLGYYSALFDAIRREGLSSRVRFLGFVRDLRRAYAAMDAVVLGDEDDAFPRCALEAQSMGVPVIGPASGGIPELIRDGVTGVLVDSSDLDALAGAVRNLHNSPELRRGLAENGRCAARRYTTRAHVEVVSALYEEVLKCATSTKEVS